MTDEIDSGDLGDDGELLSSGAAFWFAGRGAAGSEGGAEFRRTRWQNPGGERLIIADQQLVAGLQPVEIDVRRDLYGSRPAFRTLKRLV
jgi:hypothetical protein